MRFLSLLLLPVLLASVAFSQNIEIPPSFSFETKEECLSYQGLILNSIEWLDTTPFVAEVEKRKQLHKFIQEWSSETPTLLLFPYSNVSKPIFKDLKNNMKKDRFGLELYMAYLNGMLQHILSEDKAGKLSEIQMAGINNLLKIYKANTEYFLGSDAVLFYKNLKDNGDLKTWVAKKITKSEEKQYAKFIADPDGYIENMKKSRQYKMDEVF